MHFKMRLALFLGSILVAVVALTACGDATATPVPATTAPAVAATTAPAAAATTAATTSAATSAAATTSVATTAAATSAAATTPAATTAAAGTSSATTSLSLPSFSGLTEVNVDPSFASAFSQQLPIKNFALKVYVSDDTNDNVATTIDTALTGAGYKFAIPGQSKISKQGDSYGGLYAKTGSPDLLVAVGPVPTDPSKLDASTMQGISPQTAQMLIDQIKGHKTFVFFIGANDLLQSLFASALSTPSGSTTTAAATPTK